MFAKMTVKILPRLFMVLGLIAFVVWLFLSRSGGRFTYSHPSYVALGMLLGFGISSTVSEAVIRLVKILPRLFTVLSFIAFVVYLFLGRSGGHFTYSHPSYIAFGVSLGFLISSAVSGAVIWLLKDKKQEANS